MNIPTVCTTQTIKPQTQSSVRLRTITLKLIFSYSSLRFKSDYRQKEQKLKVNYTRNVKISLLRICKTANIEFIFIYNVSKNLI